jgi:hypothetical protein
MAYELSPKIMTRHEKLHPHQSEKLKFLPTDYIPFFVDSEGQKTWGVIIFNIEFSVKKNTPFIKSYN